MLRPGLGQQTPLERNADLVGAAAGGVCLFFSLCRAECEMVGIGAEEIVDLADRIFHTSSLCVYNGFKGFIGTSAEKLQRQARWARAFSLRVTQGTYPLGGCNRSSPGGRGLVYTRQRHLASRTVQCRGARAAKAEPRGCSMHAAVRSWPHTPGRQERTPA